MLTDREFLTKVKELISDKSRWTTGYLARDRFGHPTDPELQQAKCFCVYGACARVKHETKGPDIQHLLILLDTCSNDFGMSFAAGVNDINGHEDVMKLLDSAIAKTV